MDGRFQEAIDQCYIALQLDAEFGNPWNDLGSYYSSLKMNDVARLFLERAKKAKRYDCRHFPFTNLARMYQKLGESYKAYMEYCRALLVAPWEREPLGFCLTLPPKEAKLFVKLINEIKRL